MRSFVRMSLALLVALACSTPALAQTGDRISVNASVGPAFGTVGTTLATRAGLDFRVTDRVALVGEFGAFPQAPFEDAASIAPPVAASNGDERVNAYHWNGNVNVRPFEVERISPYVTAGFGSFTADALVSDGRVDGVRFEDRRRVTDFATNVGAGLTYRFTDWLGLGADYRTFFVHRDDRTPRVHRFTTGLSLFLD